MAEDLNNVFLVGRLTRDMELSHTVNGYPVGKLSLAVNRRRKNGEHWEDEVNFFDLNLWGKRAEALQRYLLKGSQVVIQGQLRQDRWEQDGQKRSKVMIELSNIQLVGSRVGGDSSSYSGATPAYGNPPSFSHSGSNTGNTRAYSPAPPPVAPIVDSEFEDDIPF